MKVRRAHGEINPYYWHAPELFQKSTFSATKIATGRTDGLRTNIRLTIVLLLKSTFLATKLGVQVQNLNGIVQIAQ